MTRSLVWWRAYRSVADVEIHWVDLSANPEREAYAFELLDETERARCRAFRVDHARQQFLLSRGALRKLLGDRLGCPASQLSFASLAKGKPYAVRDGRPAPISFNLSHSGQDGLIAIAPGRRVGVDLEHGNPGSSLDGIARRVFGDGERAALASASGDAKVAMFYRLWTSKEALIKAIGDGFSYDPARFEVPDGYLLGAASVSFRFPDDQDIVWQLVDLSSDRCAAALAYEI